MKTTILTILTLFSLAGVSSAEEMMLTSVGWLCISPEAYDQAVAEQEHRKGQDFELMKKEQLEKRACKYIEQNEIDGIIAPYVAVKETSGSKMNVLFYVKFDERIELLHHRLEWMKYTGWTGNENLTPLSVMAR